MKKFKIISSALFLLVVSSSLVQAQKDTRAGFDFGIKAGINYSNVWDSEGQEFDADAKVGFAGGVFMGIPFGKYVGFQPEVLFSQKGFEGSGTLLGVPYSFERTTNYLEVPLLLQIKPIEFVTIVAGPQFAYLLSQKDVYVLGSNSTEQQQEFDNENIRKNMLGFVGGIDFSYDNFLLSTRVGWDFQTNNGDGTSQTPRYKNQWLQVALGFKL